MNQKRPSSALDYSQQAGKFLEPPLRKIANVAHDSNKRFSRAPLIGFLTKCGLINRSANIFEDVFVKDQDEEVFSEPQIANLNAKSPSIDSISFQNSFSLQKQTNSYDISINSNLSQPSQNQQSLETRAIEESQESSLFSEEQICCEKCNFFTEIQEIGSTFEEQQKTQGEMAKKEEESKFINISSPSPASLIERNEIHEEREDTYSSFDSDFKVLEFGNISDPLI